MFFSYIKINEIFDVQKIFLKSCRKRSTEVTISRWLFKTEEMCIKAVET